jgi:menaquinone-9 beta-reductase
LLVEQKKFPRAKLCGEFISPECLKHFAQLGIEDRMLTAGGQLLTQTVFYARSGRSVKVPTSWFDTQQGALGLSRAEMDLRLLERARAVGVSVCEETQVTGLLSENDRITGVRLKSDSGTGVPPVGLAIETSLNSDSSILQPTGRMPVPQPTGRMPVPQLSEATAPVVIDATGRTRALAHRLPAALKNGKPHRQRASLVAFKAHLEGARSEAGTCEIYFYPGGYGGLNAVENGLSNLCFIAAAEDVRKCQADPEVAMRQMVKQNSRAAQSLAHAHAQSPWLAVSLESFGRHQPAPADGLLMIGDAAAFIDPFSGSGMLMALEGGQLAAEVVLQHLDGLQQGGSFAPLARSYRDLYHQQFGSRLRICAILRRAAFVPRLAEAAIRFFGASERLRHSLARATRHA